jgi:hypothetical protein
MKHCFDVEIAKEYGLEEAVVIENLAFWIRQNFIKNKNLNDGLYWTFYTFKNLNELLPYINISKLKRVINNLKEKKVIMIGNYNKNNYDKTTWYTIINNQILSKYNIEYSIVPWFFGLVHNGPSIGYNGPSIGYNGPSIGYNGPSIGYNGLTIPDINTDINTDIIKDINTDIIKEKEKRIENNPREEIFSNTDSFTENYNKYYSLLKKSKELGFTTNINNTETKTVKNIIMYLKQIESGSFLNNNSLNNKYKNIPEGNLFTFLEKRMEKYIMTTSDTKSFEKFLLDKTTDNKYYSRFLKGFQFEKNNTVENKIEAEIKYKVPERIWRMYVDLFAYNGILYKNFSSEDKKRFNYEIDRVFNYIKKQAGEWGYASDYFRIVFTSVSFDVMNIFCEYHAEYLRRYRTDLRIGHISIDSKVFPSFLATFNTEEYYYVNFLMSDERKKEIIAAYNKREEEERQKKIRIERRNKREKELEEAKYNGITLEKLDWEIEEEKAHQRATDIINNSGFLAIL